MSQGSRSDGSSGNISSVVDFNQVRNQRLDEKRRKTERIIFKNLLGVYCVTPTTSGGTQMKPLEIVDISEDGLSFVVPFDTQSLWPNNMKEFSIRLYFSQDTYLPVNIRIQNSRPSIENGNKYVRYGCAVDTTLKSYVAYQQFVRFIHSYSEHAHKDNGDVTLFYL